MTLKSIIKSNVIQRFLKQNICIKFRSIGIEKKATPGLGSKMFEKESAMFCSNIDENNSILSINQRMKTNFAHSLFAPLLYWQMKTLLVLPSLYSHIESKLKNGKQSSKSSIFYNVLNITQKFRYLEINSPSKSGAKLVIYNKPRWRTPTKVRRWPKGGIFAFFVDPNRDISR